MRSKARAERPARRRGGAVAAAALLAFATGGCRDRDAQAPDPSTAPPAAQADDLPEGLDAETAAKPVARVGDHTITVGDLARRIVAESPYLRARYQSPERRRELLDQLIDFHLLAEEAERRGYDALPEVERAWKQAMIERLVEAHFREDPSRTEVTEDEVRAFYEAHPEEWSRPEQVRAAHIVVADRALAERILAEAAAAPRTDDETWRRLVTRHSQDASTRRAFGDLGFFSAPGSETGRQVPEPVARAAFALDAIGAIHPEPVRTPAGWHVVRRTGHRPALRRPLDEVRRTIESRLWREKQDAAVAALIDGLREAHDVEEHPERLDAVEIPGVKP